MIHYLSQILGTPVEDQQGVRQGKIIDILVRAEQMGQATTASPVTLLLEGEKDQPLRVPPQAIHWHEDALQLQVAIEELTTQVSPLADEISLAHDVLDKQVIDVAHKKAVRVNDVCLDENWQLLGIDKSTMGLIRRLAPAWLLGHRATQPVGLIPWQHIELIGQHETLPEQAQAATILQTPHPQSGQLADLHPADIAEIVHQLTASQGARIIERLDDETAADTMEEIDTDRQRSILENIRSDRAADILEAMEPDEAADLLAKLPEERAEELLQLMKPQESEEVQELLDYPSNSAGGLMTTDYIVLNQTRTVAEALESVRSNIQEHNIHAAYIYCVEDETQYEARLLGVVSLWELLVANPTQTLQELMETDLISVQPDTEPYEVAEIMAKYNLFAVPVTSKGGILEGVVTIDDALDVLLPPDRQRKPPRMY